MGLSLYRRRKRNQELVRGAVVCASVLLAYASFFAAADKLPYHLLMQIERSAPWIGLVFWISSSFWVAGLPDRDADGTLDTESWLGRLLLSIFVLGIIIVAVSVSISFLGFALTGMSKM